MILTMIIIIITIHFNCIALFLKRLQSASQQRKKEENTELPGYTL